MIHNFIFHIIKSDSYDRLGSDIRIQIRHLIIP